MGGWYYALEHRAVRGVTFQPVRARGGRAPADERLTLTEVRRLLLEQ